MASQLTYLFTRNVLGGMDYTPPAMKISQLNTTAGYQRCIPYICCHCTKIPVFAISSGYCEILSRISVDEPCFIPCNWNIIHQCQVKELTDYANQKGVDIMLWYGVNNQNNVWSGSGFTLVKILAPTISFRLSAIAATLHRHIQSIP